MLIKEEKPGCDFVLVASIVAFYPKTALMLLHEIIFNKNFGFLLDILIYLTYFGVGPLFLLIIFFYLTKTRPDPEFLLIIRIYLTNSDIFCK